MPSPSRTMRPSRRDLLAGSLGAAAFAASAATAAGLPAGGLFAAGSDRIRIGLIGCGGRGTGAAAQAASLHPGVVIAALGDLFADHLAEGGRAVIGFGADRGYAVDDFLSDAAEAGLHEQVRLGGWALEPWIQDAGFMLSILGR